MRVARSVGLALACAAIAAFLLLRRSGTEARPPSGTTANSPGRTAPRAGEQNRDAVESAPRSSPRPATAPPELKEAALASPRNAVQTALRLLDNGEQDLFRETFLPSVQPQVTAEAFDACRRRVRQAPVRPDWEMAEESAAGGERVVRVSMFGKSMTGFHDVNGRWLADSLWCLPTGLP